MISFSKVKVILWDFDGVIMDSMPVRDKGFELVLGNYPSNEVAKLMIFHRANGGLSRYVKFRHFFEVIRGEEVSEQKIQELSARFSELMRRELVNPALLISDSISFISNFSRDYLMHVVSGSDQDELRFLCERLSLSHHFRSIHGSPTPKVRLVNDILNEMRYLREEVVLIGDSHNDYQAAKENGIRFFAYNNPQLRGLGAGYIDSFHKLLDLLKCND